MDKLYIETKSNLMQISDLLVKFENTILADEINNLKQILNEKLNQIGKSCDQLDIYVTKEPANRRFDSKLKVDQLKYDLQHFKAALNSIQYKK